MKARKTIIGASALVLAFAIVLTSCAEEDDAIADAEATGGDASRGTSQVDEATQNDAAHAEDAEDESRTAESEVAQSPPECMVGTWLSDNQFFAAGMESYGDLTVQSITGEVYITFLEDGTSTTEYRDWKFVALAEGETMTFQRTGTDRGEWQANDTTITMSDTDMGTVITVLGQVSMTIAPEPDHIENAPYTCEGDAASLTAHGHTHPLERR